MNLDFIALPLGKLLKFIYDTIAFNNYGVSIILFTVLVKLALLPLTLKQLKSTSRMQELQPLIADIQKRYKDDKQKMNEEMMKVYQENNYNPAGGCLPLLVQFPILITLFYVISQPLKFMLNKSAEQIQKIVMVASDVMAQSGIKMAGQRELVAMNFFNENPDMLSKVEGLLDKTELIDFNNFLGLHLGKIAKFDPAALFGSEAHIYIPLLLLVIAATVTTYISSRLTMPKKKEGAQQSAPGSSMMMYMGPAMTLMFSFQMPAGVILYWMTGYVVSIFQQLYINKFVHKKHDKDEEESNVKGKGSVAGTSRNMLKGGTAGTDDSGSKRSVEGGAATEKGKTGEAGDGANAGKPEAGSSGGKSGKGGSSGGKTGQGGSSGTKKGSAKSGHKGGKKGGKNK